MSTSEDVVIVTEPTAAVAVIPDNVAVSVEPESAIITELIAVVADSPDNVTVSVELDSIIVTTPTPPMTTRLFGTKLL